MLFIQYLLLVSLSQEILFLICIVKQILRLQPRGVCGQVSMMDRFVKIKNQTTPSCMFERILITTCQLYHFHVLLIKLPGDTEAEVHKWSSHQVLSRILQIISLEKYMCWSLFLRKLQDMRPANLLKNDFNTVAFLRN